MIAYNHKNLEDTCIRDISGEAFNKNLISQEEYNAVSAQYSGRLYSPNFFIRIGLFVLTAIISCMSLGLIFLLSGTVADKNLAVIGIFFSLVAYLVLEIMTRGQDHFKSGVDDALIWVSATALLASIIIIYDPLPSLIISLIVFALATYLALRFTNAVMAAIAFIALLAVAFYSCLYAGAIGKMIAPFLLMAISLVVYLSIKRIENIYLLRHYRLCLTAVELISLLGVYVPVNYLAVRELSNEMFALHLKDGESIPGGWLFWTITIALPIIYVIVSFKRKDALLFRVSLLLIAATVFTIWFYNPGLSPEAAMMFGGIMAILVAYFTSKYFARGKQGITSAAPVDLRDPGYPDAEALVIAVAFMEIFYL